MARLQLSLAVVVVLCISPIVLSAQTSAPIIGTWSWGGTGGKNGFCPTTFTIESVGSDGAVRGKVNFSGGSCPSDTTRVFGEDQSPGIHTHFDGTWLKIWWLTTGTRYALRLKDGKLVGKFINVWNGATTGITDVKEDLTTLGNVQQVPGTRETLAVDVVFTRR